MIHVLSTTGVLLAGMILPAAVQSRFTGSERRFVWAGFWAHVLSAFCQVWLVRHYYGGGDMLTYHDRGVKLADWMSADFLPRSLQLLQVLFHQTSSFDPVGIVLHGIGGSTGSMFAASAFSSLLLGGSLYAICLLWSLFAFGGQLAIYLGCREVFGARFRRRLLLATLLVPTVVFWSGGLVKEAFAIGGLGLLFLGVQRVIYRRFRPAYLVAIAVGGGCVALFKAYILFPFFLAVGVWYYWYRSLTQTGRVGLLARPLYLGGAACLAVGAVVAFAEFFPQYAPTNLGEQLARTRHHQLEAGGGSRIQMATGGDRSLLAQLPLVPLALATALFRPLIFEAHNALALINAGETTLIIGLLAWILFGRGPGGAVRTLARSPTAVFCLVFVLLFGTAVGLAAPNLGTMSRYRIPMMPFYVLLLLLLIPDHPPDPDR